MNYKIMSANEEHLKILPSIEHAAMEIFSIEDIPLALRSNITTEKTIKSALTNNHLWVALDELNAPVGFLLADVVDGNFHITEMDVLPDHGRKGLGARLLEFAFAAAAREGFEWITLTTFSHLKWNAPFYQKIGFSLLPESDYGRELAVIISQEKRMGLKNRICMRRKVLHIPDGD